MKKFFSFITILFCMGFLLTSCEEKSPHELRVAATSTPHAEILEHVKPLLKEKGIDLSIIVVEDYNTPNRALQDKEVDANYFQHQPFLEAQKRDFGYQLDSFANIHTEPMGLYSNKVHSFSDLNENSIIALPNDPTNQARALLLLEQQGLIRLKKHDITTSLLDLESYPYEFLEIDPALSSRTLDDVDIAAITTNFALQAGLSPQKDALAIESEQSLFANILAIRTGDENRIQLQELKQALTSPSSRQFIEEKYQGAILPAF